MQENFFINRVAVLGAGVMGAQIAAHCINAGIETFLYDLPALEGNPNAIVDKSIAHLAKIKPSPLATSDTARYLQAKNYEHDLECLRSCDLIIEAIAERLDLKEGLFKKIAPFLNEEAILASNTSGLSINELAGVLPEPLKHRFCGVHFFNPPRYMHLAELIPGDSTDATLLNHLEIWLTSALGKGVVRAKDTPNFIANRIGVFSLLTTLYHAEEMQMGLDVVDALTGPLLGRPKSATFRTMDVVGLDTMQHVVHTMHEQLRDDPWHSIFELPAWLKELIEAGHLGQKAGQGVYRKKGKLIEVFDVKCKEYRASEGKISPEMAQIAKERDPQKRWEALSSSKDKQAQFLTACLRDVFHYCAYHLESIADNVRDVDLAIRWGFGWQRGPFETWQLSGVETIRRSIEQAIKSGDAISEAKLPAWLKEKSIFYAEEGAFSPHKESFVPRSKLPVYQRQFFPERVLAEPALNLEKILENEGIVLHQLPDRILMASFKTKANAINQGVIDGMNYAINYAERHGIGLIIYQQDVNTFSAGADLRGVGQLLQENQFEAVDEMIAAFQQMVMRIKYAAVPVVAALRGRALGGGCEILLHCAGVVAAFESYVGLVEVGVGLIPAGGGCKEMALRASKEAKGPDLLLFLQPYFQQIAMGEVSASALDAQKRHYLRPQDRCVMNAHEVLYVAISYVKALHEANYQSPLKSSFKVAGREAAARFDAYLVNMREGGFISEHDYFLGKELAAVLCGGDINQGNEVDEQWMLDLERKAFMKLAETSLTQARIAHILETGKPLRN